MVSIRILIFGSSRSIGDMGMGVAKLLIASNYRVVTNVEGRRWGCFSFGPFRIFCLTCVLSLQVVLGFVFRAAARMRLVS